MECIVQYRNKYVKGGDIRGPLVLVSFAVAAVMQTSHWSHLQSHFVVGHKSSLVSTSVETFQTWPVQNIGTSRP